MKVRVGSLEDLRKQTCLKFPIPGGKEGFAIFWKGRPYAYENVCCHLPLPMDYGEGNFFSADGKHLLCRNHAAEYDPASGKCVRGPCKGANLRGLNLVVEDGTVWVEIQKEEVPDENH